jgi:RNA polymerase sigma-70 factor, ECF subfamily
MPRLVPDSPLQYADFVRDAALVERVRSGDAAAFEAIFRQYARGLMDFAYHCTGSADDADDAVQAVFARLWMSRERWEIRGSLSGYLMLATRNMVRDRIKHERVVERQRTSARRAPDSAVAVSSDEAFDAAETAVAIRLAIETLAPQRRAVCTLRWGYGLTYAEIAAKLNLAEKTVSRHLGLAYKELRQRIPYLPQLG